MASKSFVRARIDEQLKEEAAGILAQMGLTVSDVVRMALARVVQDRALPFELRVPNAETRAAMAESRAMMVNAQARFSNAQELFDALDEETRR